MMYAASKAALKRVLDGVQLEIQCIDKDDLEFESLFRASAPPNATSALLEDVQDGKGASSFCSKSASSSSKSASSGLVDAKSASSLCEKSASSLCGKSASAALVAGTEE